MTGATGYIGKRLLPLLVADGYYVYCAVRDAQRMTIPESLSAHAENVEVDFLEPESLAAIPKDLDAAFYLIHSMSSHEDFSETERRCARNFRECMEATRVEQVVYLSGMANDETLSEHLASRLAVEEALASDLYALTTLRAGIIIGSGSASFEIIRDLVEKLPLMITPRWVNTRCQPIGIRDVLTFLLQVLFHPKTYRQSFDVGGPDVLTYREMMLGFARVRKLKRAIWVVPVMTPRLSSYWLYFMTSTTYRLAIALVDSMKVEVVARDQRLAELLEIQPLSYPETLEAAFSKIKQDQVASSWKDAFVSGVTQFDISDFIQVPEYGCFIDHREEPVDSPVAAIQRVWALGGVTGWYYATWLWRIRGFMDKVVGGVGLRRGRTHPTHIEVGDAVDFWRVLYADPKEGRLLLYAEMKLPGDAWLEFKLKAGKLVQTATFRPLGLAGRLYWYAVLPFHGFIFRNMLRRLAKG